MSFSFGFKVSQNKQKQVINLKKYRHAMVKIKIFPHSFVMNVTLIIISSIFLQHILKF